MELLSRWTNGSLTGKRSEPHSTECSRMWKTPVSLAGGVLKAIEKALLSSAQASHITRARVASWRST